MANAMVASNGKKSSNSFIGLGDYAGVTTSKREYDKQRKKALLNDPGSWSYRSYADWKKRHAV
jgi:hypothetical protein